jgi:pimeloyl-ACP methyl ester carboxylesterase
VRLPARETLVTQKTFVLVHGAWRGGWCYSAVADLLRSLGHRVFTPTLTGVGERSHLAQHFPVDCSTHVQDILNVFHWEELHDVVLCGHSYGGVVITAVADAIPEHIAALVYVDAIIPEAGKSVLAINVSAQVVSGVLSSAAASGGQLAPPLPAAMLGTSPRNCERADRLGTPHPLASLCEPVMLTGAWHKVSRKTYVRATGWQGYESLGFQSYQAAVADRSWTTVDVPCGHEVMLDAPQTLADILVSVN